MKRKRLVGLILIVCLTVGLFYPTGHVSAENDTTETANPSYTLNGKKYEVYYEDDFSDGGTKYAAATGGFSTDDYSYVMGVENNALMKPSANTDKNQYRALFTNAGDTPTTNYSVSAAFKMKDTSKFTTVTAYAKNDGAGYEFGLIGTYFRIWNRSNAKAIVGDTSNTAIKHFGSSFDATEKEVTLRLEASTVNDVVTLKGYATYNGVEKLVCEATSDTNTNMSLKSGLPGLVSSDTGAPISWVSITSLGQEADANCLYSDDMTSQTGYRNALGYALSDNSYEYTWNNGALKTNSSGNTYSVFKGIASSTALQNYTISADVVEKTSGKANGLVAYMTLAGSGGSTGYEFRLYQGKLNLYGRNTPTISSTEIGTLDNYSRGDTVRLSMTVLTSDVSEDGSTGTVKIICSAIHKEKVYIYDTKTYSGKTVYQGAPGIRSNDNDSKATIGNVRVTTIDAQCTPYFEDFQDSASTIKALYGSELVVSSDTTAVNKYGTLAAGRMVYLANASTWTDYAVEADVTLNSVASGTQYAGLLVGTKSTASSNGQRGYEFDISYNPSNTTEIYQARLYDHVAGTTVRSVRFDFTPGTVVKLRMEVSGNCIKCYANDELLIDEQVVLRAGESEITGSIGLRALVCSAEFDNISVVPYEVPEETSDAIFPFIEDFEGERAQLTARWDQGRIVKLEETDGNRHATLANYYMPEEPEEGYAAYDSSQTSLYLTGITEAATWTDYVYEADVTLTDAPIGDQIWKVATIVGAVQEVTSGNTTTLKGYEFSLCYNGSKFGVRLFDRINNTTLVGKDATSDDGYEPCIYAFNETVRLKMVVSGNTIQCYVNDELKIDYVAEDANTVFSGTVGLVASGNAAKFDNIIVSSAADYYPLAQYRSDINNYTHPYKCGHVFGGWYTDAGLTKALAADDVTTPYGYAKWVAEEVLSVKAQLPAEGVDESGRTVMRIVTTTDSDSYPETGFDVSTLNQSKTYTDTRLFTSIVANSKYASVSVDYKPYEEFHESSKYFSTIILYNLKATGEHLEKVFTIKPFWVTADGTKVYGVTRELRIREGIDAMNESISPFSL